jgi:hypothetical protein
MIRERSESAAPPSGSDLFLPSTAEFPTATFKMFPRAPMLRSSERAIAGAIGNAARIDVVAALRVGDRAPGITVCRDHTPRSAGRHTCQIYLVILL